MTRVGRDFSYTMQSLAVPPISADVMFASTRFPNYKIGANDQIVSGNEDGKLVSMKEVIAKETAQLLEQQKRLSVRDLASKFEKGLAAAAKLSDEVSSPRASSVIMHIILLVKPFYYTKICFVCNEKQAKLRDVVCLEKHVLLKKLRDALESLRGRVVGKNMDDVEEAISMVSFVCVSLLIFFFIIVLYSIIFRCN